MPCLFFRNVPTSVGFDPDLIVRFHQELTEADGGEVGSFELHVETTQYDLLMPDGSRQKAENVHVFVESHERDLATKTRIAELTHQFLTEHGCGTDSDITFRDSPSETFFLNGELVPGGPLRR